MTDDVALLQKKVAVLENENVALHGENTLLKRKDADLEYKLDELIRRIAKLEDGYYVMVNVITNIEAKVGLHLEDHAKLAKSIVWDTPEEDEAWAHLQSGD